ncbi:MAG: asparagine synthase (glutamine-hydrolyzing) [Planctomycetota bacterium]|nr:asparagine synthase (glutamine-hydrolyzing) [Planctomycetota bacterium]
MCGFTGIILDDQRGDADGNLLRERVQTLAHRGPDEESVETGPGFGLAFARLAIIDLAGGRQPIWNEGKDVAVVCNGEIYNFRALRSELEAAGHRFRSDSDAEVLVHLYEQEGDGFLKRLHGMFAICVVDTRQRAGAEGSGPRVLLARDRLGIKPLFYSWGGPQQKGLSFASEPKALMVGATSRRLRAASLLDFLVQGYVGGAHSAWDGIERLLPGHFLTWRAGGQARLAEYWAPPANLRTSAASDGEITELMDRVVAERLVADVPLGAFLSGGIDSTAVVDSMARGTGEAPLACSVGFHERSHDELPIARRTAASLGAKLHGEVLTADPTLALDVLPWFFDEPHADPSCVPTYLVSAMARKHVTVALSGDGGDEVFAGYRRYVHDAAENRLRSLIGPLGARLAGGLGALYPALDWAPRPLRAGTFLRHLGEDPARSYWNSVSQLSRDQALALLSKGAVEMLAEHDPFDAFAAHYHAPREAGSLYRAQYADLRTNLPDRILSKVDRASMAVSLEVRVPLLDHRFVEAFAPLPPREKVHRGRGKHALRRALAPRLPAEVLAGTKRGFDTPLTAWIRGPLGGPVEEALVALPESWFARDVLRSRLAEHRAGRRDHGRLLWSLLVLERWRRRHDIEEQLA